MADELHKIALRVIGRDSSQKLAWDKANSHWGQPVSPGRQCHLKRNAIEEEWVKKLILVDHDVVATGRSWPVQQSVPLNLADSCVQFSRCGPLLGMTNQPKTFISTVPLEVSASPRDIRATEGKSARRPVTNPIFADSNTSPYTSLEISSVSFTQTLISPSGSPKRRNIADQRDTSWATSHPFQLDPRSSFINAVVYVSKSIRGSRPESCPPIRTVIPTRQRVFTLDALLLSTGWLGNAMSNPTGVRGTSITKGLVFLERDAVKSYELDQILGRGKSVEAVALHIFTLDQLYGCLCSPDFRPFPVRVLF